MSSTIITRLISVKVGVDDQLYKLLLFSSLQDKWFKSIMLLVYQELKNSTLKAFSIWFLEKIFRERMMGLI